MAGASFVGTPAFSYARTEYAAFGCTAINPDTIDLFSETIKDGKYLYDNEWHEVTTYDEVIKVRFGG
jgi:penicillin amidase